MFTRSLHLNVHAVSRIAQHIQCILSTTSLRMHPFYNSLYPLNVQCHPSHPLFTSPYSPLPLFTLPSWLWYFRPGNSDVSVPQSSTEDLRITSQRKKHTHTQTNTTNNKINISHILIKHGRANAPKGDGANEGRRGRMRREGGEWGMEEVEHLNWSTEGRETLQLPSCITHYLYWFSDVTIAWVQTSAILNSLSTTSLTWWEITWYGSQCMSVCCVMSIHPQ